MRKLIKVCLSVAAFVFLTVAGYAQAGVLDNIPVAEVLRQAQSMSVPQLQDMIKKYKDAIAGKKIDLQKVQDQLKQIPLTQMMGPKAKKAKDDLSKINASVKSLTEILGAYTNVLNEKMKTQK